MKTDKTYNNKRQNIEISKRNQRTPNFTSPKKESKIQINETPKKLEDLSGNNFLENTLKYLEMSNGNNNYILDTNNNYIIPGLNEEYDITKKYTEAYNNSSLNYGYYSENFTKNENENSAEKLHKVKDDYIEYLQRQLEENNKNVVKLESKLTELQKKFKNLIDDNRILSENLSERTVKLKEALQENENLRLQINNYIDNETKYKLQFEYFEKQINMYETNINKYNDVINDLKISNEKLTNDLSQNNLDKNLKSNENGKNITNTNNTNNNYNNYNYFNVKNIHTGNDGELQLIKNQNMIYENDIKSKDYTIDLITKKNQKLMNENKIYKTQVKQYAHQIMNLYNILKQKNKIISVYKQQDGINDNTSIDFEFEKKMEEFNLNFINNSELFTDITNDDFALPNMYNIDYNNLEKEDKSLGLIESRYLQIMKEENKTNNNVNNNNNKDSNIKEKEKSYVNSRRNNIKNSLITFKNKKEEKNINNNNNNVNIKETPIKEKANGRNITKKEEEEKSKSNNIKVQSGLIKDKNKNKHISFKGLLDTKEEMKETVKELGKKKNLSHVPKKKKKFRISEFLDVTEINTSSPVAIQNLSFSKDDSDLLDSSNDYTNTVSKKLYLFGINREDFFFIFDLKEKKLSKKNILEIEDISDTFKQDYQYDGTILYNTLNGLFLLTGKKSDTLYYYNPKYDTFNKICKFDFDHDNGCLLLDKEFNRIFVFGGKNSKKCEFYSFTDKTTNTMPELTIDRANGSFIFCNGKIFGFFGFSYKNNKYCGNIEFIDLKKLDKWIEVKNIKLLDENINGNFDIESVSTINYEEDKNKILIYGGIQGENEDFVIDYYLYDTKANTINIINKWENKILKYVGSRWRNSTLSKKDPIGYHFAKNSNFLKLPQKAKVEDYEGDIYLMMDYRNNVHFIDQEQKCIDIYKSDI